MRRICALPRASGRAFWLLGWILFPMGLCLNNSSSAIVEVPPKVTTLVPTTGGALSFKYASDGTIHAFDIKGDACWSFPSGGPVNTSFVYEGNVYPMDPATNFHVQEYLRGLSAVTSASPFLTAEGLIVDTALKTVFMVDPVTGQVLQKIEPNGTLRRSLTTEMREGAEPPILFQRTDRSMQCFDRISGTPIWNLNRSVIGVYQDESANDLDAFNFNDFANPVTETLVPDGVRRFTDIESLSEEHVLYNETTGVTPLRPVDILPQLPSLDAILALPGNQGAAASQGRGWIAGGLLGFLAVLLLFATGLFYRRKQSGKLQEQQEQQPVKRKTNGKKRKNPKNASPFREGISKEQEDAKTAEPVTSAENKVGDITVGEVVIGLGSHGTRVLEGYVNTRPVAVKCVLSAFYDKAVKEISALIVLDTHQNVVRYFSMARDKNFIYIALEKGDFNLGSLVHAHMPPETGCNKGDLDVKREADIRALLEELGLQLWYPTTGLPSPVLMKLMWDVVEGFVHLHSRNYLHRDLKPENVLIYRDGKELVAKISDMGISKRLNDGATSTESLTAGIGSTGWKAPEQLQGGKQTRAVDMFNLGCLLFFCISCGRHPFGNPLERDLNISRGALDTFAIEHIPEATNLVTRLLVMDPTKRLSAAQVKLHPFFWSSQKRLSFLIAASDRVEREDREPNSAVLAALEAAAPAAVGLSWKDKLDEALVENLGKYRNYNFQAVRDLLRVIRNKANHYRELPPDVQQLLGVIPQGYDNYFRSRFPSLLMEVYRVVAQHCWSEDMFSTYFAGEAYAYA